MTGVGCDAVVATDALVTPWGRSVLHFPGTVFRWNWSVGGAERRRSDSVWDIARCIHLLLKELSVIGRSIWAFFTCQNRWF